MLKELKIYNNEYFSCSVKESEDIRMNVLRENICDNTLYKFMEFTENNDLNKKKLDNLQNGTLWFSHYIYLNDKTEFEIKYSPKKVASKTSRSPQNIKYTINTYKEIYDVCSFTYSLSDNMWDSYSNHGNGICLKMNVDDWDLLFPVDYIEKWKIDYNKILINSINYADRKLEISRSELRNDPMAILPFVIKNPQNGEMSSIDEREVRILYPSFENGEFNHGIVFPNAKEAMNYMGCNVPLTWCNLTIQEIIIGNQCDEQLKNAVIKIAEEAKINYSYQ